MSTPNPLTPQSSRLEQSAKRKTNLPVIVAVFVGIHAVVFGGIMMAGCKPEPKAEARKAPEPVLPPITPPADLGSPVAPAPGTLPPIGSVPTPASAVGTPGLTPLPTAPIAPPVVPVPVAPAPLPLPEPAPVAPVAEAKVHVVAKGDSFSSIAKKYGVGSKSIEAANAGVDSTKLKIGQKINIPAAAPKAVKSAEGTGGVSAASDADGAYTVKSGDNLGSIAKRHGTTVAKIREANGLKSDQIKVGQKLKVPAGAAKKSIEPAAGAAPAPKLDAAPAPPPALPPLGEPAPAPKAPGQL